MPYSSVDGTQHISFKKDCNDDFGTIILFSTRRLKERRLPPLKNGEINVAHGMKRRKNGTKKGRVLNDPAF
jgi:hypothetical protein